MKKQNSNSRVRFTNATEFWLKFLEDKTQHEISSTLQFSFIDFDYLKFKLQKDIRLEVVEQRLNNVRVKLSKSRCLLLSSEALNTPENFINSEIGLYLYSFFYFHEVITDYNEKLINYQKTAIADQADFCVKAYKAILNSIFIAITGGGKKDIDDLENSPASADVVTKEDDGFELEFNLAKQIFQYLEDFYEPFFKRNEDSVAHRDLLVAWLLKMIRKRIPKPDLNQSYLFIGIVMAELRYLSSEEQYAKEKKTEPYHKYLITSIKNRENKSLTISDHFKHLKKIEFLI